MEYISPLFLLVLAPFWKCHLFQALKHYPSTRGLTFTVLPSRVKNLAQYGMPLRDMCRDVPTYFAQQQKEGV